MTGKTALVCGASQGIGAAVAEELAGSGCRVIALARSADKLAAVVKNLAGSGHHDLALDLADLAELDTRIRALLERVGPIHILVNNAGGPKPGPISEAEAPVFLQAFQSHVLASSCLVQRLLPGMKEARYGRVINIISTSVKTPIPNLGVSNTIRGAMASWAKTLSREVASFGITVNNILPGYTQTPRLATLIDNAAAKGGQSYEEVSRAWQALVPAKRFAEPGEIAAAATFLASPAAGYINGINLPVDGGRTVCL